MLGSLKKVAYCILSLFWLVISSDPPPSWKLRHTFNFESSGVVEEITFVIGATQFSRNIQSS